MWNSPEWYAALTLQERADLSAREGERHDRELAERRRDEWKSQQPFETDGYWSRRLARDGLDEATALPLLGESHVQLQARCDEAPPWIARLEAEYSRFSPQEPLDWPARPGKEPVGFLNLVEPIVRSALERVRSALRELKEGKNEFPIEPESVSFLLLGHLSDRLRGFLTRALVLEMRIASLEGQLEGDTGEERFASFIASLRQRETAIDILRRYPVLARQALGRIDLWEEAALELIERLADDHEHLRQRFFPDQSAGTLEGIEGGLSDPHRNGRTVFKLRFSGGGETWHLIYKPKPLAVDVKFQELLCWIEDRGFEPAWRTLEVLDRGDYGWVGFVEAAPVESVEQVRRFYQRQGAFLALFYLLEGTDFHQENLIAAGEHPVPVDLETLFHPRVDSRDVRSQSAQPDALFHDSVLRIGLLPHRIWGDETHEGVDMSGLGSSTGGAATPLWSPVDAATDEMRFEKRSLAIPASGNRPALAGEEIRLTDYRDAILEGFERLYRLLLEHRDELLAPDGPLAAFEQAEVRVVFRSTRSYAMLLVESFHPQALGNALEHTFLFDKLWREVEERPYLEHLIPAEQRDFGRGDIPVFTTRPGSRDLWTSSGEKIEGLFGETGLERAQQRLERFGDEDLQRQLWIIRGTLTALELEQGDHPRIPHVLRESHAPPSEQELIRVARSAGDELSRLAFRDSDQAQWWSIRPLEIGRWGLQPAGPELYLGLSGIALFLGYLGHLTGVGSYAELARLALVSQRRQIAADPSTTPIVGGFTGRGGAIYALTHLGALWNDEELLAEAVALTADLAPAIEEDEQIDLTSGVAGCLAVLLGLHGVTRDEGVWRTALRCGDLLLEHAREMDAGIGWVVELAGPIPLAGMSHGAAGIALALLRLWEASGEDRFRRAACDGLAYERSLYDPRKRNWPDLRESGADLVHGEPFMCSWCHGAAGVGLARVAGLPQLDDAIVRGEIEAAAKTTLECGFGESHSLCHGDLGNLDFLLEAARATHDAELEARTLRLAGGLLASIEEHGWRHGMVEGAEPLGFMVGLAGIGYGLLRLAAQDRVPSALALAPPALRGASKPRAG